MKQQIFGNFIAKRGIKKEKKKPLSYTEETKQFTRKEKAVEIRNSDDTG